jgi:hypothetical protein
MDHTQAAVYYAIAQPPDGASDYLAMLINSLRSLRDLSPPVKVYCVLFGSFPEEELGQLESLDVVAIRRPAVSADRLYLLKFLALEGLEEATLLFLDADTFLFEPVERIWEQHADCSFYARVESGCDRSGPNHSPRECNWPLMDQLADELGLPAAKKLPLYNNGVMVFNRYFHQKIFARLDLVVQLRDRFARGELPYPHFFNRHIVGEIATLFMLGAFPDETLGVLSRRACTFWHEHELSSDKDWGVVCHTFAAHYDAFLQRLPEALLKRGTSVDWR